MSNTDSEKKFSLRFIKVVAICAAIFWLLFTAIVQSLLLPMAFGGAHHVRTLNVMAYIFTPLLVLEAPVIISFLFYKKEKYKASIAAVPVLYALAILLVWVWQASLSAQIQVSTAIPSGFLAPTAATIPPGFQEINHDYFGDKYSIFYRNKASNSNLNFQESGHGKMIINETPIKTFVYDNQPGQLYGSIQGGDKAGYELFYDDHGKQLIIDLGPVPANEVSPDDVIKMLSSLKRTE